MQRYRSDLHEYQRKGIDFILEKKRCALFLSMGLGKTTTTLTAVSDLKDSFAVGKTLVIAPLRVANSVWLQETRIWDHLQHLTVSICTGPERNRTMSLSREADIYVINRENVAWLVQFYGDKWPFDCVVIDEASSFKSSSSQRFKALKKILPYTDYMILLTGTPSPNGLLDLWSQIYLIDFGNRLGRTMTAYKQRFFESDYMGYKFVPREGSADKIHDLLKPIAMSMKAEDYLELPDRIDIVEKVDLPAATLREYREFEKHLLAELPEGEEIEAVSAAVLANKLLQWCISENTLVVTYDGLKPIQTVTPEDLVWDGEEYVNCCGSVYMGEKPVINCYDVLMTEDHKVLTELGWMEAGVVNNVDASKRPSRADVRIPDGYWKGRNCKGGQSNLVVPMRLREQSGSSKSEPAFKTPKNEIMRMQAFGGYRFYGTRPNGVPPMAHMVKYAKEVFKPIGQRLEKLRGARDNGLPRMGRLFKILGGYAGRLFGQPYFGSHRQQWGLFKVELSVGNAKSTVSKYEKKCDYRYPKWADEFNIGGKTVRSESGDAPRSDFSIQMAKEPMVRKTYDILNCGPRNRFVVLDSYGNPLIVHNCNGALYTDDKGNWAEVHKVKIEALADLIEQNEGENILVAYNYKTDLERLLKAFPQARVLDKNPQTVVEWNNGQIPLLLAHPASAGHGLNLQRGGSMIVWFGLNWSLELYQQFNARLHRQGQDKPVRVVHIVAADCIDQRVMGVLADKDAQQSRLLNALKPKKQA